jgi:hypothetical protein
MDTEPFFEGGIFPELQIKISYMKINKLDHK